MPRRRQRLKGFIVGTGHEAQVFKNRLDRMEENVCKCGQTPSEVGEEFVSSEDEGRTELSYALAAGEEYMAPPVENSIPLLVPAPATCWLGPTTTLPPMEEISKEHTFICEDLDGLLREVVRGELGISRRDLLSLWYILHPDLALRDGEG